MIYHRDVSILAGIGVLDSLVEDRKGPE